MKKNPGRRSFIKAIGISSVGAAFSPVASIVPAGIVNAAETPEEEKQPTFSPPKNKRPYNSPYKNEHLNRIAFPIGGMGAGMFCMEGTGSISHMSVRHRPEIFNEPGMFAALHVKGMKNGAKLLEGPVPDW